MTETELREAIASLRRVAQQLRADRNLEAAIQIERGPLAEREAELAALTS